MFERIKNYYNKVAEIQQILNLSRCLAVQYSPLLVKEISIVSQEARSVDGWLSFSEGWALYLLAKYAQINGDLVEIGSFKGRSTIYLASGVKASNRQERIYAIDHHQGSPEHQQGELLAAHLPKGGTYPVFKDNIKRTGLHTFVEPLVMGSDEAYKQWNRGQLKLLFIDGGHEYDDVSRDFKQWETLVAPGGIIAFHDVNAGWDGPNQVFHSDVPQTGRFEHIGIVKSLGVVRKSS